MIDDDPFEAQAMISGAITDADAQRTAKEMLKRSRVIYERIKAEHGRPVAVLLGELANITNLARLIATIHGENPYSIALGQVIVRLTTMITVEFKVDPEKLADMLIELSASRMYQPIDQSKVN